MSVGRIVGLMALCIAAVVIAGVVVALVTSDDDVDPSDVDAVAADTAPEAASDPRPTGEPLEFDALIDELIAFVETERGLEFKERPVVEILSDDAFVDRLLADFDEETDDIERFEGIYRAVGFVEPGVDLVVAMKELFGDGVAGFYDPESGELVVRGDEADPYARTVIVHELTHALDDQWFDLDRPEYEDADDEIAFGFIAVVEGNAERIEDAYFATLTRDEQAEARATEATLAAGLDLNAIPLALIQLQVAPYITGAALVGTILDAGGQDALAAALESPPVTSEQVLDPAAFLAAEPATAVQPPPAEGEIYEDGAFGQVVLQTMLFPAVGQADAATAASGWGGDWFVAWADGARDCLRVDIAMDTADDTAELREALRTWAGTAADARVEDVSAELTRLTTCA